MRLASVMKKYRIMSELDLRRLASDIGISAATLSRIESGEDAKSSTVNKILVWLLQEGNQTQQEVKDEAGQFVVKRD